MAEQFLMPKLGLTMESGTVVKWLVEDGASVASGQPVLLIETDKVESEVESTGNGTLRHLAGVGDEFECGAQIGWLLAPGEDVPAAPVTAAPVAAAPAPGAAPSPSPAATAPAPAGAAPAPVAGVAATGEGGRLLASPNARRVAAERGIDLRHVVGTGPGGRITSEDVPLTAPAPVAAAPQGGAPVAAAAGSAVLATVAARQLAELLGIDLATVPSGGADPRIGRDDVAAHVRSLLAAGQPRPTPTTPTSPVAAVAAEVAPLLQEPTEIVPMAGMRRRIAERMSDSLASMAQLSLYMDVDMSAVQADRNRRRADGAAPGFTDYVIAATAKALQDHPYANSQITEDGIALLPQVNIGLAVALEKGLIVPVVHGVPDLTLDALSEETTRLASAAREGRLALTELEGGTFSVTALGMFDVDGFTPIINSPNTAILGVGRLRDDVAWADDGSPRRTTRLTLSLTWDHRAFDGAPAAEFTRTIKRRLESLDF